MLELGADWKVDRVDLNTEEKSVKIKLSHNGSTCFFVVNVRVMKRYMITVLSGRYDSH